MPATGEPLSWMNPIAAFESGPLLRAGALLGIPTKTSFRAISLIACTIPRIFASDVADVVTVGFRLLTPPADRSRSSDITPADLDRTGSHCASERKESEAVT